MTLVDRVDGFQRRHPVVGFPLGVVYKFLDDQGAYLAALITYYGLLWFSGDNDIIANAFHLSINSITQVNLDNLCPEPFVAGLSSHGGYCGPAVKPIALNMVQSCAADPEVRLPISGIVVNK